MKQLKPKVVTDFRGVDYVQSKNVCGNTTYVRNYQVEYLLSLAPEHVNKLLTSLSENGKLNRYQHREQLYDTSTKHHIYMCVTYYLVNLVSSVVHLQNSTVVFGTALSGVSQMCDDTPAVLRYLKGTEVQHVYSILYSKVM